MKLIAYIQQHGHANWRALPKQAGLLRCGKSCRLRWINYLRPDIKRGNFTQDEEETIIRLHHLLGNKWSKIASHLPGRTDNEIKNIWNIHLKKRITHSNGSNSPSSENSNQHKAMSNLSSIEDLNILDSEQLNIDHSIMESDKEIMSTLSSPFDTIDGAKTIPVEPDFDIGDVFDDDEAWLAMEDTAVGDQVGMSGGAERDNWIAELERELGLWGSSEAGIQCDQQQNVQASCYFQTRPPSPFLC
ncbi:hypothetical protein QJS10_CPB11g01555 [Acorus calamus]|uniref:Uncharacterized protein n=1 Tax=Acorus calamus TaxID=4465 RepID=A0AAV9DVP6_ACOCL|nr:hypothetical protein QJS10_CPB11g01555 [Acorus calamus]